MSEQKALYERILNDPISHPDAKKAASELLAKANNGPLIFSPSKEADTKALKVFRAIVNTAGTFELEKIPFTLSSEVAEQLLSLAECGYLNRYAVEKKA